MTVNNFEMLVKFQKKNADLSQKKYFLQVFVTYGSTLFLCALIFWNKHWSFEMSRSTLIFHRTEMSTRIVSNGWINLISNHWWGNMLLTIDEWTKVISFLDLVCLHSAVTVWKRKFKWTCMWLCMHREKHSLAKCLCPSHSA